MMDELRRRSIALENASLIYTICKSRKNQLTIFLFSYGASQDAFSED